MKTVGKILIGILEAIIVLYAIFVIVLMLSYNEFGYTEVGDHTFVSINDQNITELSDFKEGDLISIKSKTYNEINAGDEVYYYATLNDEYIIVKDKLLEKDGNNREAVYNFEHNDSMVTYDRIIGTFEKNYEGKGKIYDILLSTVGFLLLVILPVLVIFIYQVYKFVLLVKEDKELTKQEASPIKLKPREK